MHIDETLYISELPQDCIDDCSRPGPADRAVHYWRKKLDFTVNQKNARAYLDSTGGWDEEEIAAMSDVDVAEKILWIACGDFYEQQQWEADNPNRPPEESAYGCSVFCMEA